MGDSDPLVCYTIGYNTVTSSNQYFPCGGSGIGGAQSCCYAGDYCMDNSMSHYTHTVENGTGYYMAGCTDSSWEDPACPKQCTSQYGADVIYDTTNDRWNCCFSREGFLNCKQPSDFIVQAPAPNQLETLTQLNTPAPSASLTSIGSISSYLNQVSTMSGALDSISTASSSSAETTSSTASASQNTAASATATSSTSASATPSPSSSLSGGAIAGIVIGAIAGLTLLAVGALFLYRWNKRNNAAIRGHQWNNNAPLSELSGEGGKQEIYPHHGKPPPSYGSGLSPAGAGGHGYGAGQYHELSSPETERERQELPASWEPAELGDGMKSALSG